MRPQDLRIGNYVRIKESGRIVQVDYITKSCIGVFGSCRLINMNIESEIEPVLIREVYNSLPSLAELTWNDWVESGNLYQYGNIPIKYLHELQTIHYALTGNEIEIEI